MSKKYSLKKVLVLVSVLALPGLLYFLLQEKGQNRYRPLEIFGPKQVASTFHTKRGVKIPDTIYHQIRDFKLLSHTGDSVGFPTDSNRIALVNFFFINCDSFCGEMNRQMARVVKTFGDNRRLTYYSISVDPERDTQEALRAYANTMQASARHWYFLTGNRGLIYSVARKDFLVDAHTGEQQNLIHSPMMILVDRDKRIRGYYDSTSKEQMDKLIDEIKVLITEDVRNVNILKPKKVI